ncbi:MAG TPA: isoprenylcysteine carboxylmethyltransferase family protein [Chthoniobacteraceae bacterium]|nr:isoprenylcysteine carboxylmethyltransferase family protein [Chthoniobacteraceae bacterium]
MQRVARVALFIERYALSLLFFWFASKQLGRIEFAVHAWRGGNAAAFADLVNQSLIFVLQLVAGIALLVNKPAERLPQNWKELVVPLLGTFFYLSYGLAGNFPEPLRSSLAPRQWQAPLAAIGLGISCVGSAIAAWGAITLGRSFAVLVAVRDIVSRGPYRFVRHPIYLGYILNMVTLFLSRASLGMALLVATHFAITLWRAQLEEASLQAHSETYRRYAQRTGFLLPRFRS